MCGYSRQAASSGSRVMILTTERPKSPAGKLFAEQANAFSISTHSAEHIAQLDEGHVGSTRASSAREGDRVSPRTSQHSQLTRPGTGGSGDSDPGDEDRGERDN